MRILIFNWKDPRAKCSFATSQVQPVFPFELEAVS